jgi:predicted phosphohydrolase
MSLYAIGDLHLHYQSLLKAPGQLTEKVWKNHEERFRKNCAHICDTDTLVLVGDHSWGRNLAECEKDMQYIIDLPGKKVLLRGNHDMFWDAKKTTALNRQFEGKLFFLQNNYFPYRDYALVGTKGYTFEGPFYLNRRRQITGWDDKEAAQAEKLVERELSAMKKRAGELDTVFKRMYEDSALGRVTSEQFRMLSAAYTEEKKQLAESIPEKAERLEKLRSSVANARNFIAKAKRFTDMDALTPELLHTFVAKIIVYEKEVKYSKHSPQKVRIQFRDFDLTEDTADIIEEETAKTTEKADSAIALSA